MGGQLVSKHHTGIGWMAGRILHDLQVGAANPTGIDFKLDPIRRNRVQRRFRAVLDDELSGSGKHSCLHDVSLWIGYQRSTTTLVCV